MKSFQVKKRKILSDLSVPSTEYKDRSPKGSVDEGIRDLIDEINAIEGLVTTSSCAGRVAVFLEGEKISARASDQDVGASTTQDQDADDAQTSNPETSTSQPLNEPITRSTAGGKGHGGRWLFVSHDPITLPKSTSASNTPLHDLFHLTTQHPQTPPPPSIPPHARLIRLQFEPLLLHILCATLDHAHAPLSAAISTGFRESGVQSLSCLSHPATHHPIIGVRSSGLAFSTVIGYVEARECTLRSLVSEPYLAAMVSETSRRFVENRVRRERFLASLRKAISASLPLDHSAPTGREDPVQRARRKREEGLLLRRRAKEAEEGQETEDQAEAEADALQLDDLEMGLEWEHPDGDVV